MAREKVIGSYLLRFTEVQHTKHIYLHDLKTGKVLEFETWVSAWCFLEHQLYDSPENQQPGLTKG